MGNAEPEKLTSVDGKRYTIWKRFFISDRNGSTYLRRLRVIQTPHGSIYLHNIDAPDPDPQPHDHPWNFFSLVLRGGYTEKVTSLTKSGHTDPKPRIKRHRRFSIHYMPAASKAHMITSVEPGCITLVIAGKRRRDWGFWTNKGWVQWKQYLDETYGTETTRRKEPLP